MVHVLCQAGHALHGRIADARFNSVDRQYYSYIFSLVLLAPASLYLNEAFEALHFKELYQVRKRKVCSESKSNFIFLLLRSCSCWSAW